MITCGPPPFARLDLAQQLEAVAVGHQDVAEHEVVARALDAFARLLDGAGGVDVVPLPLEEQAEEIGQARLVVDDQQAIARAHAVASAETRVTLAATVGSSTAMVVPAPGRLSTRRRPPWS